MKLTFDGLLLLVRRGLGLGTALGGALLRAGPTTAQPLPAAPIWRSVASYPAPAPAQVAPSAARPAPWPGRFFEADTAALAARLALAPAETAAAAAAAAVRLPLPLPDGTLPEFGITQVAVMAPGLAARYPGLRAYAGRCIGRPDLQARLTQTSAGVQIYLTDARGDAYVEPVAGARGRYRSYARAELPRPQLSCQAPDEAGASGLLPLPDPGQRRGTAGAATGAELRTFRLALACTGEYAQARGGDKTALLGRMAAIVNNLNLLYEQELAVRLVLIDGNDKLIFFDPATDPYTSGPDPTNRLADNGPAMYNLVGANNFDLGHVIDTYPANAGSGIAQLSTVCGNCSSNGANGCGRGRAASAGGDDGLVQVIMRHEVGHQFGAAHTFNSELSGCGGNNRSAGSAVEPGSGVTVMSYGGSCGADNLVGSRLPYFHAFSLQQMQRLAHESCGAGAASGNAPPTVRLLTRAAYIPKGTPFELRGAGADADGHALTYSWEEVDASKSSAGSSPAAAAGTPNEPLFRSYAPGASPLRSFPSLAGVLSGTPALGELLPQVARTLRFSLSVRDGHGGLAWDTTHVKVADSGPFRITNADQPFAAAAGSAYTVRWDVAGTTAAPVRCAAVRVLFSADGGASFPYVLAESTPNNGRAVVRLPNVLTTQGRLRLESVGNIFYDLNHANLTLSAPLPARPAAGARLTAAVYPNPVADGRLRLRVELPTAGTGTLRVRDALGRLVRQTSPQALPAGAQQLTLPLGAPAAGLYWWQLEWNGAPAGGGRLQVE